MADVTLNTPAFQVAQVPIQILGENANRKSCVITNAGANTVTLNRNPQGTPGQGHVLPAGASIGWDSFADRQMFTHALFAVAAVGANLVTLAEEG